MGTKYDCVARDILENRAKKALIVKDGFADLSPALSERIKRDKVEVTTVYMVEEYFRHSPLDKVSEKTFVLARRRNY